MTMADMTLEHPDATPPAAGSTWWGPGIDWLIEDEPEDIYEDSAESVRRYHFLHRLGDYAGRLWNRLREAESSPARKSAIDGRVARFRDKLTEESQYSSPEARSNTKALEDAVEHLQQQGYEVDLEMAKLAILVYSKRNEVCHAKVGAEKDPRRWTEFLHVDLDSLQQILPDSQFRHYYSTWQRIIRFYEASQGRQAPRHKDDRTEAHRQSADTFPDLRSATTPERAQAFQGGAFHAQLQSISRTPEDRKPHTPYLTRTRSSMSDLIPYCPRKRSASGSPDPDGGTHGIEDNKTASPRQPFLAAFGDATDSVILRNLHEELKAIYDKNPGAGRRALEGALQGVRKAKDKLTEKEEAMAAKAQKKARRAKRPRTEEASED